MKKILIILGILIFINILIMTVNNVFAQETNLEAPTVTNNSLMFLQG